ncbi:endo alpha-1,4 polygalactosaminidase [Paraburkholderia bryophila]|uniref:endo alpha-1,4 polygalactosaminidase n=1 Tax=Paraburkholderia bryophila TaxID=420952 RepID=UPI002349CA9C|nr:endo alpha-1,4 polygalactosaminidase [Paraburkholderia bryophila]WCM21077.1 endo alpha-1,4 polygalactosaminidase [Paraburkholderia bryophila]
MFQLFLGPLRRAARVCRAIELRRAVCLRLRWRGAVVVVAAGLLAACGGGGGGGGAGGGTSGASTSTSGQATPAGGTTSTPATPARTTPPVTPAPVISTARALPVAPVWAVYYGNASGLTLSQVASTFKLIVIDADPGTGTPAFSAAQIAALKANGAKVLSYLNLGACEKSRSYWNTVPSGFVSCGANTAAQLGKYSGFQEYWMNPANADYQNLLVNYVAPRLAATGVDGFMLDNFEIVGHGTNTTAGPCDATCAQGGLDLVKQLRDSFPNLALVPNAAPVQTIGGSSGGVAFPWLIDGVLAEQVYLPSVSTSLVQQLQSWQSAEQNLGRSGFFVGSLDYASSCTATSSAQTAWTAARQAGFSPSISIASLDSICWWSFLTSGS